jgi:glycogen debranching enzyme
MFDRGVPLIGPDLSAFLVVQMDVLSELAQDFGRRDESAQWKRRADALCDLLMAQLWQGDHFVARLAKDGAIVESQSLIPWLPIILGHRLPVNLRQCLKDGIEKHLTEWGLATERTDSPKYNSNGYWRGPIWGPSTVIAVTGLEKCGFNELAREIAVRFSRLCDKSGFAENYDALTGTSLCDPAYTWTASAYLMMLERL